MPTYTVTTVSDVGADASVTGTLADETADGLGLSLREAIELSNAGLISGTITFADGPGDAFEGGGVVRLVQGPLITSQSVVIDGDLDDDGKPDVTISGDAIGDDAVFTTDAGLVLTDPFNNANDGDNSRVVLVSAGTTSLNGLVVTGGSDIDGGAILVQGGATLETANTTIGGNWARAGAGMRNDGTVVLTDTTFEANLAPYGVGGAIRNEGVATISGSTFVNNSSFGGGAALHNTATATVENSTFVNNVATRDVTGGGTSSAVENNGPGSNPAAATITLTNTTITGSQNVKGAFYNRGQATLANNLILGNAISDLAGDGTINDPGPNIIGGFDPADVFAAIDPTTGGGALGDNGGPTRTVALLDNASNPALDSADAGFAPAEDQRGVARPQGDGPDLGAFELEPDFSVIGFGDLKLRVDGEAINAPAPPELNQIDASWITGKNGIKFKQLVAFVDTDDDASTGTDGFAPGFEEAYNLSDRGYGHRVKSLAVDNDLNDPVVITAWGRLNNRQDGDLTSKVRFHEDRGFGLDNGPNGEGMARWLDSGDAVSFAPTSGAFDQVTFTVSVRDADKNAATVELADLALDSDGDTMTNPTDQRQDFTDDFLIAIAGISDGTAITFDFAAGTIAIDGDGTVVGDAAAFLDSVQTNGNLTFGTPASESVGLAIADLQLRIEDFGEII